MAAKKKEDTAQKIEAVLEGMNNGKSVLVMCKQVGFAQSSFYRMLQLDAELLEKYTRAREAQADYLFDEILAIVDEPAMMTASGSIDSGDVAHKRLRMDARKWHASKLAPKKYGERIAVEAEIKTSDLTDEQLDARIADLAAKAGIAIAVAGKGSKE